VVGIVMRVPVLPPEDRASGPPTTPAPLSPKGGICALKFHK